MGEGPASAQTPIRPLYPTQWRALMKSFNALFLSFYPTGKMPLIELRSIQSQWEEVGESVPQTVGHSSPFTGVSDSFQPPGSPMSPPGLRSKSITPILDKPWKSPGSTTSVGEQSTAMPSSLTTWATWLAGEGPSQERHLGPEKCLIKAWDPGFSEQEQSIDITSPREPRGSPNSQGARRM